MCTTVGMAPGPVVLTGSCSSCSVGTTAAGVAAGPVGTGALGVAIALTTVSSKCLGDPTPAAT